ncbi:MAG TPA: hypothetical protein VGL93_21845 [Streptosporangiaceae bacterium]|jgi:hypothetical protein
MADDEPDGDGAEAPPEKPPGRRWRTVLGRVLAVGVAVLGVAAVAVPILVHSFGTPDTLADVYGPVAAARTADHMAYGPTARAVPRDCGVPPALARKLAGRVGKREKAARGANTCTWGGDVRSLHYLSVTVRVATDRGGRPDPAGAVGAVDQMIADAAKPSAARRTGPVTRLSGLGQQAAAWTLIKKRARTPLRRPHRPGVYHGTAVTRVAFQVGNVAAEIGYGGVDRRKHGLDLSLTPVEPITLRGAFSAAASVARAVGAPVHETPHLKRPSEARAARNPPSACAAVPLASVRAAAGDDGLARQPANPYTGRAAERGIARDYCAWGGGSGRRADVDMLVATGAPPLGDGASVALRDYVRAYRAARETPPGRPGAAVFTALRAPGDEAFAAYATGGSGGTGTVAIRVRNIRIQARCTDTATDSPDTAMNCAYAIATAVAKRVAAAA